jgi:Mg2+ and Co2+ transporter CorA
MAVDGLRGAGYAHKEYEPWDIQDLQHWQDKTNETVMVLEANAKILRALRKFYSDLVARKDFPEALRRLCEDDLVTFLSQLDEITSDFDMQIARARLLLKIISDRKELVLQHLQSQASERTEQLNRNLEREAIVMRIITIVTLLYLPATFVSVSDWNLWAMPLLTCSRRSSAPMS